MSRDAADCGYGDWTLFRLGLAERGLRYVVQVDPTAVAYPADAAPITPPYSGRGRPPRPAGHAERPRPGCGAHQRAAGDLAARQPAQHDEPDRGDALARDNAAYRQWLNSGGVRTAVAASVAAFVLSVAFAVADLLGAQPPSAITFVPLFLAGATFATVLYTINDRRIGWVPPSRIWAVLRELPTVVLVLLGILLVAQIADGIWKAAHPGMYSDADDLTSGVSTIGWISLVTGALAVGVQRQRRRAMAGTLQPMDQRSVRRAGWAYGALVAAAVALALVTALREFGSGVPVFDESSVHTDLANQYAGTVWVPHLTAANTYHGEFQVFLDTDESVILDAACRSLIPYGDQVGRAPRLYVVRHGRGTFLHTCR